MPHLSTKQAVLWGCIFLIRGAWLFVRQHYKTPVSSSFRAGSREEVYLDFPGRDQFRERRLEESEILSSFVRQAVRSMSELSLKTGLGLGPIVAVRSRFIRDAVSICMRNYVLAHAFDATGHHAESGCGIVTAYAAPVSTSSYLIPCRHPCI